MPIDKKAAVTEKPSIPMKRAHNSASLNYLDTFLQKVNSCYFVDKIPCLSDCCSNKRSKPSIIILPSVIYTVCKQAHVDLSDNT